MAKKRRKHTRTGAGVRTSKHVQLPRAVQARYDAAQTTRENQRHWLLADALSPNAATNADVRRTLRMRSRYEIANNSYAKGMIDTLANDCVGTTPRLQLLTDNSDFNWIVEQEFMAWAQAVNLPKKLRTMRKAKVTDGEAFGVLTNNRRIAHTIKLDLRLFEADQCVTPMPMVSLTRRDIADGMKLDADGNPAYYYVLKDHPGETLGLSNTLADYHTYSADNMIHWFNADRPGQLRGVPEITPAIPLFSQLRRYTLAVLGAAETVADFAAVLFTNAPANGESATVTPMDIVTLEKRMATVLPEGWELGQIKPEQPNSTYAEFKKELLNEIARCIGMPFNIAACNSAGYNYASGRLDHQGYFKTIKNEQYDMAGTVLDVLFMAWLAEARLVLPMLKRISAGQILPHQWFFDGNEHVDPQKEAKAQEIRLTNKTTTLADEWGRQGQDWEVKLEQRIKEEAKEKQLREKYGIGQVAPSPQAA
jgi:capsid protein